MAASSARCASLGEFADIEQRQSAARDLLRTAVRIAIERRQQARRIERRRGADRDRDAAGAGNEIGKKIARQRQAFALAERLHRAPRQDLRRRPHCEHVAAFERKARRTADAHPNGAAAGGAGGDRDGHRAALLGAQRQLLRRSGADQNGVRRRHGDRVIAGLPFDIVEIEMNGRAVAGKQEARQRRRQHDRIAHDDVGGGVADLVLAPRHRHDAQRAFEIGHVERNLRVAVRADRDDAGIERHRRSRGRTALQLRALVAAGANLAARALHAVDQLAVEVADFRRKRALAEIVIVGRRRLVVRQIENADVDRGDHDSAPLRPPRAR